MNRLTIVAAAICLAAASGGFAQTSDPAQNPDEIRSQMRALPWKVGPTDADLEGKAKLQIPDKYRFLDAKDGGKFLKLTGNLPQDESILYGPGWWAVMGFDAVGFVKDDEKVDPDQLLSQLKGRDQEENEQRKKIGEPALHTLGWSIPPHYDATSKHLEWGLRIRADGDQSDTVNYTVRLLGRTGYESATLVSSPETLDRDVASFKVGAEQLRFQLGREIFRVQSGRSRR